MDNLRQKTKGEESQSKLNHLILLVPTQEWEPAQTFALNLAVI